MKYATVCSGINAPAVAWESLGWEEVFCAEIEAFPCSVLKERHPHVPNLGDMTQYATWPEFHLDLLCGGTPCQSFSLAGLRKGMDDPRGQLTRTFIQIAARYRPRWVLWENVPGVLSADGGEAFAGFLAGLCGRKVAVPAEGWGSAGIIPGIADAYGLAYRVLDTQFVRVDSHPRACPQRRERVFVVGHLGGCWQRAAAVLLERESLCGNPAPRRTAGERVTGTLSARTQGGGGLGTDFECGGGVIATEEAWPPQVSPTLDTYYGDKMGLEDQHVFNQKGGKFVPVPFDTTQITSVVNRSNPKAGDPCHPLAEGAHPPAIAFSIMPMNSGKDYKARETEVSQPLMAGGPVGGNQGGDFVLQPPAIAIQDVREVEKKQNGIGINTDDVAYTVDTHATQGVAHGFQPRIARNGRGNMGEVVNALNALNALSGETGKGDAAPCVATGTAVRRLTPKECARLQGFPDDYLDVTHNGKPAKDGPKYRALGNAMSTNCMRWLGQRIQIVNSIP